MSVFPALPLGQRIPASIHAVSCSLPTMQAVHGYEEKNPEITRHLTSGYPRFVVHPFLQQLSAHLARRHRLTDHTLWLVSSAGMADRLAARLGAAHVVRVTDGGIHGIAHPESSEFAARAKTFLQNTGGFLSSREAEDRLVKLGRLPGAEHEELFAGDALAEVRRHLAPAFTGVAPDDLLLTNSGMNAMDAAFRTVSEMQAAHGRSVWVQLGWLYLDTIALLKRFTPTPSDYVYAHDVFDLPSLDRLLDKVGDRLAGIVSEIPTNPLIQSPDIAMITARVQSRGGLVVLDPSVSSAYNVDLLPHADILVSSLTKYTAHEGDVIAGVAAINPRTPESASVRRSVAAKLEPIYSRDLARLAAQIGHTQDVVARSNASVPKVVEFLQGHPAVAKVYWSLHPASRENYLRVARSPHAVGSMITFTLRTPLETFYDRLRLPKGPSFGMKTTLICPFMYLAHYDLVTTPEGRKTLASSGLDSDLLRLSVGCEPVEDIIGALAEALA